MATTLSIIFFDTLLKKTNILFSKCTSKYLYFNFTRYVQTCICCKGEHKTRDQDGAQCEQNFPQAKRPHLGKEHLTGAGDTFDDGFYEESDKEKNALLQLVKMKTINEHLCSQVNIHEEKLCGITDELNNTW